MNVRQANRTCNFNLCRYNIYIMKLYHAYYENSNFDCYTQSKNGKSE